MITGSMKPMAPWRARPDAGADVLVAREQIASLSIAHCRMAHERLRVDGTRIVWLHGGAIDDPVPHNRLCPAALRSARVGCAHTNARRLAVASLRHLVRSGVLPSSDGDALIGELIAIGNDIELLDYRRYDAEHTVARAMQCRAADGAQPIGTDAALAADVRACEVEHDAHVSRLREWRRRTLLAIDAALAATA